MEHLSKLFGSPARVKLLRLFLFNSERVYDRESVIELARITPDSASKELAALARAGIIARKTFYKEVVRPGGHDAKKRKTIGWMLNTKYPYVAPLTFFLRETLVVSAADIKKRLRGTGSIQLLILSGVLIDEQNESAIDLLLVVDKVNEKQLRSAVSMLEAECGRELRYAVLAPDEYRFRLRVRDKLIRDLLDFPHTVVIDKLRRD